MDDLSVFIKQLSLEEKAKLCVGKNYWQTFDIEKIDLPSMFMSDGPSGLRKQEVRQDNITEGQSKISVCFPSGAALASSWDKALLHYVGSSLGKKAAAEEVDILLAPGMNIKRTPLCGRNFEYYSEDPLLSGELAASFIQGVQEHNVAASPKHFALNNQETKRKAINVVIGERELREIYLYNFELALKKGRPWSIMSSYNKINGDFTAENHPILQDILRDEWGYDGVVISDWGAIDRIAASIAESFNLQMPGNGGYSVKKIIAAVQNGELDEDKLDEAVLRILKLAANTVKQRELTKVTDDELHLAAYEAAVESMVLLKNKDQLLPIRKEEKVLVVGEMAITPRYQVGGGSAFIRSYLVDNPLEEISKLASRVNYAKGYSGEQEDPELLREAVEKAMHADKVILFAGLPNSYESEGFDRQKLDLPDNQVQLIKYLSQYSKNIAVVLANGSAVSMPWLPEVKAVLETYLGGEAMGKAAADLLYGLKNPSGKLAETFPVKLEDTPAYLSFPGENNIAEYKEGIFVGYRYYDKKKIKPLFPFGYGLSYTSFRYSGLRPDKTRMSESDQLEVEVTVKNTGVSFGKEVVQLYVGKRTSNVIRPVKELKAFDKISLKPGEAKTVRFSLSKRDFSYYQPVMKRWITEPGFYELMVGSSSKDILLSTSVEIESKDRVLLPVTRNTAFGDVADIPELNDIFMPFFDNIVANIPLEFGLGDKKGKLAAAMLRGMTFSSIASYVGEAVKDEMLEDLLRRLNERLASIE